MTTIRPYNRIMNVICVLSAILFTETLPAAVATPPTAAEAVPTEVLQALDDVYLAAKQAGAVTADPMRQGHSDPTQAAAFQGRVLAVGIGIIAGVVAFNLATSGTVAVPILASVGGGGAEAAVLETSIAIGRVYTTAGAVVGGIMGDHLYRTRPAGSIASVPASTSQRVGP